MRRSPASSSGGSRRTRAPARAAAAATLPGRAAASLWPPAGCRGSALQVAAAAAVGRRGTHLSSPACCRHPWRLAAWLTQGSQSRWTDTQSTKRWGRQEAAALSHPPPTLPPRCPLDHAPGSLSPAAGQGPQLGHLWLRAASAGQDHGEERGHQVHRARRQGAPPPPPPPFAWAAPPAYRRFRCAAAEAAEAAAAAIVYRARWKQQPNAPRRPLVPQNRCARALRCPVSHPHPPPALLPCCAR